MTKPKSYTSEFKFKVSLEMVRGDLTMAELISKYQVPRSVLSKWKKQFLENGANIFRPRNQPGQATDSIEIERLHATIGRLKVENDFLHAISAKLKL